MSGIVKQFLAAFSCNCLGAACGSASAWGAPNYLLLTSDKSPFESGPLTREEASLVVSLPSFGAFVGILILPTVVDRFGRKTLLILTSIPLIVNWVLFLVASNVYYLYVARVLMGFTFSGTFTLVPIFISEIADEKVRGALGSMLILITNAGCLFAYAISNYLDYYGQIKMNLLFPILFLISFTFFPESPEFLLRQNRLDEFKKSFHFYHGTENKIRVEETEKLNKIEEQNENENTGLSCSDFTNRTAKKAIIIGLVMCSLNQFCGESTLLMYANKIFRDSGSTLSEGASSVIIGLVQSFANIITILVVDKMGRKFLLTVSLIGSAIGLVGMGCYDIFKVHLEEFKWIPLATFSVMVFMSSIGILPLTYVVLSEILPKNIKSIITLLSLELLFVLAFTLASLYPTLSDAFGPSYIEFLFAACCIVGTIFFIFYLPETKAKTYEEIMIELNK